MATCIECLSASLYTITSTHHGDVHGVFDGVTVHYYIYSPWRCAWSACRHHCTLLHLLTMATCMECLSPSLYTITSTHHGDVHRVFVGITVQYYIYSPWRCAWSVCRRHCTLLHLLTMATCMECLSASLYTATVWMPIFRAVRMIRHAISPRFAIRIFSIGWTAANVIHLFYHHSIG